MREFTIRAVVLGLVMSVILGAANAYLGLRAGVTIAATYPAAVISMAVLRALRSGTILEENLARTAGSIGESVAAGAIFTLPAFMIAGAWPSFDTPDAYWKSTALMVVGGVLGVLFVSLMRRVMVEDPELPFPESTAAAEIHKAGQAGASAAKYLFYNMGFGAVIHSRRHSGVRLEQELRVPDRQSRASVAAARRAGQPERGHRPAATTYLRRAHGEPGVHRRRLHHRPEARVAELRRRRVRVGPDGPAVHLFLSDRNLQRILPGGRRKLGRAGRRTVWRFIVRPIAVGGMLVGAAYTLFRMRKSLSAGWAARFSELAQIAPDAAHARAHRALHELEDGVRC